MHLKNKYTTFEEAMALLLKKAKEGPVTLKTVLLLLSGRGKVLLLIFLSLGFGQIPGVALFLGLFIVYLGIRIAIGRNWIWVPKFLINKKIPSFFLKVVLKQIVRFLKFMKRWSSPRYTWATQKVATRILNGLMISLLGLSLALMPPLPFTGSIAFVAMFSLGIGLLNDDGIYMLVGYAFVLIYFFIALALFHYCSLI